MMLSRPPILSLQPFIQKIWASAHATAANTLETTLPSVTANIVVRLDESALHIVSADNKVHGIGQAVIAGVQTRAITKLRNCHSAVGAVISPGALPMLTGSGASELTDCHVPLDDVVNAQVADSLIQQLREAPQPETRLQVFETFLANLIVSRSSIQRTIHPAAAFALANLGVHTRIGEMVPAAAVSHRYFNHQFNFAVGVSPKSYQRLLRLGFTINQFVRPHAVSWSTLALEAGYADQAHFSREFKTLTGLTPSGYAQSARRAPWHVAQ